MDYQKKKNIILIGFILVSTSLFGQETNMIASCCNGKTARCTGSAYCSACKNCKYCKHCNSGGSCGVCSGGNKKTSYPSTLRNSSTSIDSKTNLYYLPNDIFSKYYLKNLMVNSEALNLRSGPGTEYLVFEKLNKYQGLIFLAMTGNWVKVKVKSTNTIGFVHYKYVVLITD